MRLRNRKWLLRRFRDATKRTGKQDRKNVGLRVPLVRVNKSEKQKDIFMHILA
jgi:hypothetical protein